MLIYAQTTGSLSTNSPNWVNIPGLVVKLPRGVGEQALLILNVPNPYSRGPDHPGGNFGLRVAGTVLPVVASFTYSEVSPADPGRVPTTLCAAAGLSQTADVLVEAVWSNVRGSTVYLDTPATLTAILE
jgi:mannose-binding lectin